MITHQEDWAQWLPMATAVHNNAQNTTTQQSPNTVLMGFTPTLAPSLHQTLGIPAADDQVTQMIQTRKVAVDAINQPTSSLRASFAIGEHIWLEGKNLPISTGSSKLRPKRYGPFKISRVVSPVVYQLELPSQCVTAPSDSLDSSSLRRKLYHFRDERIHYESQTPKGAHTESRAQRCILNRRLYLGFQRRNT